MKRQLKYFLLGAFFLFGAMLTITLLPVVLKEFYIKINPLFLSQIELFLLLSAAVLFLFSPKYYKWQILCVLYAILYYLLFLRIWF